MFFIDDIAHASTEAVEGGVAASLGLNTQLFAFQLINFAIVFVIIWFLILKPLAKKLEERRKLIDESIDKAKEVEANYQMSERKYQEKIDEAKGEANKIIEKAYGEGEKLTLDIKEKAKKEIGVLVDHAKRNIQNEKKAMMEQIKKETAELVVQAVEKILDEKLDEKKDKGLIENVLRSFRTPKG